MMGNKRARSRWPVNTVAVALASVAALLAGCNKPPAVAAAQTGDAASRFAYVVHCDGRVDKLDTRERTLIMRFTLSEKSGTPSAVPNLASAGGQMDGCLAQRVRVDATAQGASVSLIAPKDARLDANGVQEFQVLTFALPNWTLTRTAPAGKFAEAPWLRRDAAGVLQVVADDPALSAAALDLREFSGAPKDSGALLVQSSGDVSLLSLLYKDSTALALGLANSKTRTVVPLADLPPTTLRNAHLAPGGDFVLIERTATVAPYQTTGALRLYGGNGKAVADLNEERIRSMSFVALTPNGLAVYSDASGAYQFVPLGTRFAATAVVQSPLANPSAAPAPTVVFAAE